MISGNLVGSYSSIGKTFILQDSDGNEVIGVVTENPVVFTATDNDVREGSVYASNDGVSTGTKDIPVYNTTTGYKFIDPGSEFEIVLTTRDLYDFTKLQCMICAYNSTIANSVATEKVVIENNVYNVNSTDVISTVTVDNSEKSIKLGIINEEDTPYIIRFFTYKEIE